ncbi:MAG: hypothetical protein ACI9BD_001324, partial [Candidatus Marinamargulisbacteria bacterium]
VLLLISLANQRFKKDLLDVVCVIFSRKRVERRRVFRNLGANIPIIKYE